MKYVDKTLNDHCCVALRRVIMNGELEKMWKEAAPAEVQMTGTR